MAAGPVSRILSAVSGRTVIPLGHALLRGSSDLPGGGGAPSRHASPAKPEGLPGNPSLFGLAPCGVALPAALLRRRCALTAPFHPYLSLAARAVCFLWHFPSNRLEPAVPDVIRHTALRSSDFPLSCDSDRPVRLPTGSLYSMASMTRVLRSQEFRARTVKLITQRAGARRL